MGTLRTLFARYWRNIHFISVFVLAVLLLLGQPFINSYVKEGVYALFYSPFAKLKLNINKLVNVSDNNRTLMESLVEASFQISLHEETVKENERLRSILGFEPPPGYTLIPAEVIAVSGHYLPTAVTINKGEGDSLRVNMPVINQQGLIGRVSDVTADYAEVQLLTDPTNRVAARVASSREMGIVKFIAGTGMILDNFPIQGTVTVSDTVISSGLGRVYPPGLFVGTVVRVEREELEPFCDIKLKPAANFYSIEELFILREVEQ